MSIHPTAIVDAGAELGVGVEIGPYAVIGDRTHLGDGCRIGPHAVILPYTRLGARCRVHAHAVLGDLPQDLSFQDAETFVEIGPECDIREGVTIHRGTKPGSSTTVGRGCLLMVNSHLGHNVHLGEQVILANGVLLAGHVHVGDRAFLSGNVVVHQFTRIGRLALLSGGSGIGKDVPPFCITAGIARNRIAGLNVIGLRRAGFTVEQRRQVKRAFDLVYRSGLNVKQALEALRAEFAEGPATEWTAFIEGSRRGLCPMGADGGESEGD